jgi:hypothetical protein
MAASCVAASLASWVGLRRRDVDRWRAAAVAGTLDRLEQARRMLATASASSPRARSSSAIPGIGW